MNLRAATRVLAYALALCSAVAGSGCTHIGGAAHGGAHAWTIPGTLRWADGEDLDNLNPLLSTQTIVNDLSAFTMGYFFLFDDRNEPVPSLCVTFPTTANGLISKDGRSLTFKLRHGVVWHDGAPFTSADVAFTVKTILDARTNVLTRRGWDEIVRVDTPDPHTAIFRLKRPYAPFVNVFFTPVGNPAILPKHLLEHVPDINKAVYNALPVGLGPFKYVRWDRGSQVVMEPFDRWWGGVPKLKRVVFKVIPDANTVLSQLRSHELDLYVRAPNYQQPLLREVPNVRMAEHDTTSYGHIDFNVTTPTLRDVRVRRALIYGADLDKMWRTVDHGIGRREWTPISHLSWAYNPNVARYPFDPAKAAKLLDEAGWKMGTDRLRHKNGETMRLRFAGNVGNIGLDTRVLILQSVYTKLGVELEYFRYPTNTLFAGYAAGGIVAKRHYDMASYAWSLAPEPEPLNLYGCDSISPKGQNYLGYCNRAFDRLAKDALRTYDRERRKRDLMQAQTILANDAPTMVISQRSDRLVYNDDLRGPAAGPSMIFWNVASWTMGP
ncbi:MAG: peptide ABC transporter substrate-binding protein [Candidatus Eremiobacteraeota bacterium]|nr:peptide ABC transporter substrate-binding protein [Candidatus Eremiobacteraeota bacterium]